MTEAKPIKSTYAQRRIAYLRSVAAQMEAFKAGEPGPREKEKAIGVDLDAQYAEIARACREVQTDPPEDKYGPIRNVHVAIRAWELADEFANGRIATLKVYVAEVRRLAALELRREDFQRATPQLSLHRTEVQTLTPRITELRDALGEEQHEIEGILNDVGRSLETYSLARGAHDIADFVAGEIAAAVGAYREWPNSRGRTKPATPPSVTRVTGVPASETPLGVDQTVAKVSRAVERALRPAFADPPTREVQVQDVVETILKAIEVRHVRDREVASVGPTVFKPDFTFGEDLALEIKLATAKHNEREIQRELSQDVAGYGTKWKRLFAIIYDTGGAITDPEHLKSDNERHFGVTVLVIKH